MNHQSTSGRHVGGGEQLAGSMGQRFPQITQQLRSLGVERVCATYEGENGIGAMFLGCFDSERNLVAIELPEAIASELGQWFLALLKERWPDCFRDAGSGGCFDWHVVYDTFEHQHDVRRIALDTTVRHGL